ncbi:flagellinolysin [Cellvibrio fontiphilus]|uniref:Flagellinolysin n=1 Tax=Cellvibrio fontiphilus TaxID=1815559 RepID=A0ABV7FK29_9GAMM
MTFGTLKTLSEQEYLGLRYEFLKEVEEGGEENLELYPDTKSLVSTGVGFNLTVYENIKIILQEGFDLTEKSGSSTYKEGKTEDGLIKAILLVTSGTHSKSEMPTIQTKLNALMEEYTTTKTEFKFEAIGAKTAKDKIKEVFNQITKAMESEINSFLSKNGYDDGTVDNEYGITNMTYSLERLALLSLAYGGPAKMLGNGLGGAIKDDNRVRAWFEIRYASNGGDGSSGHAKRRYMESEMFGLYPSSVNFLNPQGEAQFAAYAASIIAHFEADAYPANALKNNLLHMIDYEKKWGYMIEEAQANINNISGLSLLIKPWGELFKPIASYLINHYIKDEIFKIDSTNYFFDGQVNIGLDVDGVIKSLDASASSQDKNDLLIAADDEIKNTLDGGKGDDFLIGAAKDDVLKGGDDNDVLVGKGGADKLTGGKGNDLLIGGTGNDTYIFEGNFGTDIIKDSDGSGSISIAGFSNSFTSVQGSDIIFRDAASKFEAIKINNGSSTDLLITSLTDTTTGNVLIKNWNPGNLGISLTVAASTPPAGSAGTVKGDGGNNAITLDNLRDDNPNLDIGTFSALYADGDAGNDIIMGMLQGNDTLLGGAGDDIISGGFTTTLGSNASSTFQSVAAVPGADSIDGGAGNDFIFASAGGSIAHGGSDNDILVSTGPAYFQFNNLKEILADESRGIAGHRAIKRDEVYADAIARMNFGVVKNGLSYQLSNSYFKDFTNSYAEYNSVIENVKFIGRSGSTASNHSNGDVSYGFAGSYTLTYDYSNDGELKPLPTDNPSPASLAISTFAPGAGKTLEDFANVKGANLFGDAGDDYLSGGIYADYLSGGDDKDTVFAGAGNDIVDGGDGDDELHGGEGRDIIIGGEGDDILIGDGGNDLLIGGEGRDGFIGGEGDDILVGGVEDQYMSGGAGNNIYIFEDIVYEEADLYVANNNPNANALGYAALASQTNAQATSSTAPLLTIESTEGNNTLALVGVSSLDQISLTSQDDDLILRTGNAAIFIRDGLNGAVDHFAMGDSVDEFKESATSAKSITMDDVMLARLSTEVTRTAQTAGTQLAGGLLNDTLFAHAGGSTLIGGRSDDILHGDSGDDVYVIRAGDGVDSITEQGGNNTIRLTDGITADQLDLLRTNGNLLLILSGAQSVVVNDMFDAITGDLINDRAVHRIEFSNGEVWDLTRLLQESAKGATLVGGDHNDFLIGYESDDTLTGGKGNDILRGDKGDDHYYFAIGDGADQIDDSNGSDHVYFAEGISEVQVSLRKDTSNNLIIRINNNDSITVLNAFNTAGELIGQAIENIHFNDTSVWDLARIQTELAKDQLHIFTGTTGDDLLVGDNANQTFIGNQGDDQLNGGSANDVYQYALGHGNDVITDINGNDRLELLAGINESEVVARRDGDDLVITMKDGGSITIQNTFGAEAANVVDPVITTLIQQLQSHWMSQAEIMIEQHYGLTGSGDITLGFEDGLEGAEAAHVEATYSGSDGTGTNLKLVIDLSDFSNIPNGAAPLYLDRIIAHEMVHAVMARNMNNSQLPGWFNEGTAEFIHGADERVKGDASIIGLESNFNQLFKTTVGSPSTSAGYSVSYIAVKLLDREIRNHGGAGIKEVFDQLKTGKTLDQALIAVSTAHNGLAEFWNNLSTFETHFKAVGFAQYTQLLNLDNLDTGSIAGSDYGNASLNASSVISDAISGPSHNFNLIVPDQYISTPEIDGLLESIKFSAGGEWDFPRITQEVLKPTNGDDVIHAFDSDDVFSGAKGNDQLFGYAGNDVYRYALGDGNDVIVDSAGTDQIEFGVGILEADIKLRRDLENNLVITLQDNSTITVKGAFDASGALNVAAVESIKFMSGNEWNGDKIREEVNKIHASIINGTSGSDTLLGTNANDIIVGAQGDDYLQGKKGDDRYVYNLGDGNDQITDESGIDEITFGEGISPEDISLYRQGWYGLRIVLKEGGTILINNMFSSSDDTGTNAIEGIRFFNDEVWDLAQIKAKIIQDSITEGNDIVDGFSSNDVIDGGGGFDQLRGKGGNDRYIFNRGDGVDIITDTGGNDTLVFGSGIAPTDVAVHQSNGNFYFILNNGEMVQITGELIDGTPNENRLIERVEFAGEVVWEKTIIQQKIIETLANPNFLMGRDTWDHLYAGSNNSVLNGLGGNDQIYGGDGNDTLTGGGGLNFLDGGKGDDTYLISEQPAINFIENFRDGFDRILFAEGITPEDISVKLIPGRQEGYLQNGLLWVYSISQANDWNFEIKVGDTVVYLDSLLTSGSVFGAEVKEPWLPLGEINFFNGTQWTVNDLLQQAVKGTTADDYITGSGNGDVINGSEGNDVIHAKAGADILDGGEGDDTLTGGYGKDVLIGGKGNDLLLGDNTYKEISNFHEQIDDVYRFNRGDGNDTIQEYFGRDIIEFGAGINKEQVVLSTVGDDTVVSFLDSTDTITIKNGALPETQFYTGGKIEIFKFVNGDVLNFDPKMNPVFREGTASSDTLVGGLGNDTFIGHEGYDELKGDLGDDEYRYNLGDGFDYIDEAGGVDKVVFGSEITADMVQIKKSGFTFDIYVNNQKALSFGYGPWTDSRTLEGNPDSLVESLVFANGDVWDLQMMIAKSLTYTAGDDVLSGTANNDLISGGDGNDVIQAGAGNDTLIGGKGNDGLWGSLGDDVYQFDLAEGIDSIFEHGGNDTIRFGSGILSTDISVQRTETDLILSVKNANPITLSRFFNFDVNRAVNESSAIENIIFANGEAWSREQLLAKLATVGTSSANILYGLDAPELIDAKEGNDSLSAGGGNDTLIGGSGNDTLHGESGDDLLQGGDGADWLYDAYGSNIYVGGKGNDFISLSYSAIQQFAEPSTIRFGLGDGIDEIHTPTSNPVTIELGAGITPDMLAFKSYFVDKSGGSWMATNENRVDLLILGTSDRINKLLNNGTAYTLKFSDDTIWTAAQLNDAAKKSMAILSENRNILTGNARPNSKIYISYLNQNNSVTEYPVIQTDASGYYEFDFGFGIKDVSRIIISSKDANGYTLPITAFGPATDTSTPPAPIAELDASGYVITGFARPGAYVSVSTPNRHVGAMYSDLITGAFTIVAPTRLNNGENISVVARVNALIESVPTVITAPDLVSPLTPSGVFDNLGNSLSGSAEKGAMVSITTLSGNVLGSSVANAETGAFAIGFAQPVANGELIQMVARDTAGNYSSRYVRAPDLTAPTAIYASIDKTRRIIKGFTEPGATVVVRNTQGGLLRQVYASAIDGSFEAALSTALAANQMVNLKVIDTSGNASTTFVVSAGINDVPVQPQVTFDAQGDSLSGVSSEAGIIIVRDKDSVELARTTVLAGTSFNIVLDSTYVNQEIFSVSLQNAEGLESAPSYLIAPDKIAPAKPIAAFDRYNSEISGFAEPQSTIQILGDGNSLIASATANSVDGAFVIRPNIAISESTRLSVISIDRNGNVSSTLDLTPNDQFSPITPTASFNNLGTELSGTAEPDTLVFIEKSISGLSNQPVVGFTRADLNGIWSIELAESIIDGSEVRIISVDAGNNRSYVSIRSPDLTAPLPATAQFDSTGKIITGTAEYTDTGGNEVIAMDGTNTIVLGRTTLAGYTSTYKITLATELSGNERVNIFVKDLAGNLSYATAINAPDKTAPAAPTATIDSTRKIISGESEAGATVQVKNTSGAVLGSIVADAITGAYSITLETVLAVNQTVNVTAKDLAGNISPPKTVIATGTADNSPPAIPSATFDSTGTIVSGNAEAGSVVVVKNASNTSILGTVTAHPTSGAYSITLVPALINKETVNITATDAAGNVSAARALVAPDGAVPDPTAIIIQAENYTSMSGVQKENTSDIGGGQNAGYIDAGDWMAYNNAAFNVPAEGRYRVTYRVASLNGGGQLTLKELSTDAALGSITVPKTSGWQTWVDVTQEITLSGGEHNFKLAADIGGFNVNWFKLELLEPIVQDTTPPAQPTAVFDSAGRVISGIAEAGSVVVVKDASNTNTLGTVTANTSTGAYSITLTAAFTKKETVNVTATDMAGNVSMVRAVVAPEIASPNPTAIMIQAENYSSMGGVQTENTSDTGGGQNVGWLDAGDWMAYSGAAFNVPTAGRYKVTYRVASFNGGGRLTLKELGDDSILGSITIPKTGAWQNWVDVTQEITLGGGEHHFKLAADIGGFNINWFKLEPVTPDTISPAQPTAVFDSYGKIISGVAEAGSVVIIKNHDNTQTLGTATANTSTGAYSITLTTALTKKETVNVTATDMAGNVSMVRAVVAPDIASPNPTAIMIQAENYSSMGGVQTENTSDTGGGQNVGWLDAGDWMAYSGAAFNVPTTGRYKVTYRVASFNGGGRLTLKELGDDSILGSITIPKTGAWQNWVDVTQEITLGGGEHHFKLAADIGGFNINWFKLEPLEVTASGTKSSEVIYSLENVATGNAGADNFLIINYVNNTLSQDTITAGLFEGGQEYVSMPAEVGKLKTSRDSVDYVSSNDALIQAIASFSPVTNADTRYGPAHAEQNSLMIAVGA